MQKSRNVLLGVILALFVLQGALHETMLWPKWKQSYAPKNLAGSAPGLSPEQFLVAITGFREMVAGILWVRADAFFDSGNFDAILPIIRLVTILDPNQIDVYATGMWHIGYNFTDEQQRSDRRYLTSALALGAEGSKQNPDTYEMYFETGWIWYHKVDDLHEKAVSWFEKANAKEDIPAARRNLLAKAYERNGQIDKMLDLYSILHAKAVEQAKTTQDYQAGTLVDTIEGNWDNLLVRMVQRGYQAKKLGLKTTGYDTEPPFDVGFSVKVTVPEPNVIRFQGTWNVLPVGTRIKVILRDADMSKGDANDKEWFGHIIPGGVEFDFSNSVNLDPPKHVTYMQDQLYVRNRHFDKTCDLSKDITMYPFVSDKYVVEFMYDPRSAPPHIQDRFSWNGEGMTDQNFLSEKLRPNDRVMYTTLELTRDQIKRRGEFSMSGGRVPVVKTTNYVEPKTSGSDDDIIKVPSLRGGSAK